jgi:hypothetical protein
MHNRICTSLEEFIISSHFASSCLKKVTDVYLDRENLDLVTFMYEGEQRVLPLELWGPPSEVFLACLYGEMIKQGYLPIPINDGWAVIGGGETYYLNANGDDCTCPAFVFKKTCKHKLMLQGHMSVQRRVSISRQALANGALA